MILKRLLAPRNKIAIAEGQRKPTRKVVTLEEAARRFMEDRVIVIPTEVWEKVAASEAKNPIIGWNIGVNSGPIHAGDSDPDDQ